MEDREALRFAIAVVVRAAVSFVVAVVAAAIAHLVAEDPETDIAVAVVAWLGTFGWLLWRRL